MPPLLTPGPVFTETQWFYRRWWWLILGVAILTLSPLALLGNHRALLIAGPLTLLLLAGLWFMKLTVRIDSDGIHYHYSPLLNRWRHWPWSEFRQVFLRVYSPMGEYGGWGIRGLSGNLAYNVWGTQGVQLVFRSGNKLLLGTQQAAELQAVLAALYQADKTRPITLAKT